MGRLGDMRRGRAVEVASPRGRELAAARAYLRSAKSEPESVLDRVASAILKELGWSDSRRPSRVAPSRAHHRRQRGARTSSGV